MSTAIQHYEGMGTQITQFRDPQEVLAEAQKAAKALIEVVKMKKDPVIFNGETYLEREDWGTVARFYNCTAKPTETRYVEYGDVRGFEATAVVIDMRTGVEVGRAESMCLNDEDNWGLVPVYEWQDELDENGKKIWVDGKNGKKRPKAKRVQVGAKPKPLFQLRSMAQTRAEAKALKGVFSWLVVLAGYKPTPAEEMTGHEFDNSHPDDPPKKDPIPDPQPTQQGQAQTAPKTQDFQGVIDNVKKANSGTLWLTVKGLGLVKVEENKVDGDMKPGYFIQFHGRKDFDQRLGGDFYVFISLRELSAVQDGEAPAEEKKLAPDAEAVAKEMFPDAAGKATVEGMVENGTLKPASEIEAKTIGKKRAQRIYALATQNKAKNNGLTEANIKDILSVLPKPLEHLSDLEPGMYEQFEKWATGEEDWKAWLDAD